MKRNHTESPSGTQEHCLQGSTCMLFIAETLLEQGPGSNQLHTECVHLVGAVPGPTACALASAHCVAPFSLFEHSLKAREARS